MKIGEWKVAKQSGPKGYFGRVVLEVEPKDDGEITIEFDEKHATRWQSGARFGIDYALEHVSLHAIYPNGLKVRVTTIEGHDVDTTSSLIAFVAAHATFQALGVDDSGKIPNLDFDNGLVEFAK